MTADAAADDVQALPDGAAEALAELLVEIDDRIAAEDAEQADTA